MLNRNISLESTTESNFNQRKAFYRYQGIVYQHADAKKFFLILLDKYKTVAYDLTKAMPKKMEPEKIRVELSLVMSGFDITEEQKSGKSWESAKRLFKLYVQVHNQP